MKTLTELLHQAQHTYSINNIGEWANIRNIIRCMLNDKLVTTEQVYEQAKAITTTNFLLI